MELSKQNKTDLLEIAIMVALFFLIVVIYVPVAIWEEENDYTKESRYRMKNLYDVESFLFNIDRRIQSRFFRSNDVG